MGGVRKGVDPSVSPARDRQRHRVEGSQLPYCILLTKNKMTREMIVNLLLINIKKDNCLCGVYIYIKPLV